MYYFPSQAVLLLGVRKQRLFEYIKASGIGRRSHAPKRLMLSDKDLLKIWQDSELMDRLKKTHWQLTPKKPRKPYVYVYKYVPYKRIPRELWKPRGGKRPGAGRPRKTEDTIRWDRGGNPWAKLLKKEGLL